MHSRLAHAPLAPPLTGPSPPRAPCGPHSVLEFQQNHRLHSRWANVAADVASNQLGHKKLRTIRCPVTDSLVHARGATADQTETERMVSALAQSVRRMSAGAGSPPKISVVMSASGRG